MKVKQKRIDCIVAPSVVVKKNFLISVVVCGNIFVWVMYPVRLTGEGRLHVILCMIVLILCTRNGE